MSDKDPLDGLTTPELHDLAVRDRKASHPEQSAVSSHDEPRGAVYERGACKRGETREA